MKFNSSSILKYINSDSTTTSDTVSNFNKNFSINCMGKVIPREELKLKTPPLISPQKKGRKRIDMTRYEKIKIKDKNGNYRYVYKKSTKGLLRPNKPSKVFENSILNHLEEGGTFKKAFSTKQ